MLERSDFMYAIMKDNKHNYTSEVDRVRTIDEAADRVDEFEKADSENFYFWAECKKDTPFLEW